MSGNEDCCTHVAFIYGGITLSPKPPAHAPVPLKVNIGIQLIPLIGPATEEDYLIWHYLAIVRPGDTRVVCTVGDAMSVKAVNAKDGETSIVNFCFGRPVESTDAKVLPKIAVRPKRRTENPSQAGPLRQQPQGEKSTTS